MQVQSSVVPPKLYEVSIKDFTYDPEMLTIKTGDAVSWKNIGKYPRTVTSTNNFDSGIIIQGQTYTRQFDSVGTYKYQSSNYGLAKGTIIVSEK